MQLPRKKYVTETEGGSDEGKEAPKKQVFSLRIVEQQRLE